MYKFDKLFGVDRLVKSGVLLQIFPLHDLLELKNLLRQQVYTGKQTACSKLLKLLPASSYRLAQYYSEDFEKIKFRDLTAYKNYFGEQRSLANAFFNYFFAWFLFPAVLALPLVIFQYSNQVFDTKLGALFAIFISLSAILMIEFWKRKEKQISYQWGLVRPDDELSLVHNPKFKGFNKFSWSSLTASKTSINKFWWLFSLFDWSITTILLLGSVAAYVVIKIYVTNALYQGYALSVAVGVINQVFILQADFFVTK